MRRGSKKKTLREHRSSCTYTVYVLLVCMYNFRTLLGIIFDNESIHTSITHLKHNFFTFQPTLFRMTSYNCHRKVLNREVIITALTKVQTRSGEITDKATASNREI